MKSVHWKHAHPRPQGPISQSKGRKNGESKCWVVSGNVFVINRDQETTRWCTGAPKRQGRAWIHASPRTWEINNKTRGQLHHNYFFFFFFFWAAATVRAGLLLDDDDAEEDDDEEDEEDGSDECAGIDTTAKVEVSCSSPVDNCAAVMAATAADAGDEDNDADDEEEEEEEDVEVAVPWRDMKVSRVD